MSSRLHCWLHGHAWGRWRGGYVTLFGAAVQVRWCGQCGARQIATLRLLAPPYDDRPGCPEAWRP